jgi:hypothetical protein
MKMASASAYGSNVDVQGEGCTLPLPETLARVSIGNYDYYLHAKASPSLVQETQAIANVSCILPPFSPSPSDSFSSLPPPVVPDFSVEEKMQKDKDDDALYGYSLFFLSSFVWSLFM